MVRVAGQPEQIVHAESHLTPQGTSLLRELAALQTLHLTTTTASMEPSIRAGQAVAVRARRHYHPGDVVAFREHDRIIVHRLLAGAFGLFFHAGDAPTTSRGFVRAADIVGRVESVGDPPRPPGPPPPAARQLLLVLRTLRSALGRKLRRLL